MVLSTYGKPEVQFVVEGDSLTTDAFSYGKKSTNVQFFDDRVVGVTRSARIEEEPLAYWLDGWRSRGVRWQVITPPLQQHDQSTVQYRADAEKVILTVGAGSGRVQRVHHFEPGPSL